MSKWVSNTMPMCTPRLMPHVSNSMVVTGNVQWFGDPKQYSVLLRFILVIDAEISFCLHPASLGSFLSIHLNCLWYQRMKIMVFITSNAVMYSLIYVSCYVIKKK